MKEEEKMKLFNSLEVWDFNHLVENTAESLAEFTKDTYCDEAGYFETVTEYIDRILLLLTAINEKMKEDDEEEEKEGEK